MIRQSLAWKRAIPLVLMIGSIGFCDTISLKSGKAIEGRIVEETPGAVKIDVGGVVLTLPRARIESLSRSMAGETTSTVALAELERLELQGKWVDLYEAATDLLKKTPRNKTAAEKQKLAADKIRAEMLGGKTVDALVRARRFPEAIAFLTAAIRKSGLATRPAGAVGRRALAEVYLASAEAQLRVSLDGHAPLSAARKARELDPTTPRLDYVEGWAQMKLRNFKEAAKLLERAAAAQPKEFGIRIQLMRCYRQTGDYAKITKTYETAPEKADAGAARWPEVRAILAEAFNRTALELADKGSTAPACAAYEKYLRFTDRTTAQMRDAVAFFERMGDAERAKAAREERFGRRQPEKTGPGDSSTPKPDWLR